MKIITCNFQGRKHLERNEPCEDSISYIIGSDVTTVAVADGAGNKMYVHAKEGADAVTKAVCSFFEAKFDDFFDSTNELELRTVIQTVCHKALKERAVELGLDSIDTMASTLLVVSVKGNKAVCIQIGDGLIGRTVHGELEPITLPQNGEYASSTYFVNSAEAYKMIQVRKLFLSGTSHLFLMSDGIADCMFNDFNGVFNNSLSMLLEASGESDGEEKVRKAVKEFIVDADPMSDDCTMAVVCLNTNNSVAKDKDNTENLHSKEVESVMQNTQHTEVDSKNDVTDTSSVAVMAESSLNERVDNDQQDVTKNNKKGSAWKIIAAAVSVILVIILAAGLFVHFTTGDKKANKDGASERVSTSSTAPAVSITVTAAGPENQTDSQIGNDLTQNNITN